MQGDLNSRYDRGLMEPTTASGTLTLLARLSKVVHRKTPEELLGMRWRQFMVLSYLQERDGIPQQDLGEVMGIDPNNLVLLLNELETLDFAARRRDQDDRRRHIVELTENGRAALRRAERARDKVEDDVLAALDADERAALRALLIKALEG